MNERSWPLAVVDERGKRHRGVVSFSDRPPKRPPAAPAVFHVALLAAPATVSAVPGATAVCVPKLARSGAIVEPDDAPPSLSHEIAELKHGRMSNARHAQYRAGDIVLPAGSIAATKVFLRDERVDFEHLALLLVAMQRAETLAPYLAIIRHELDMPPTANALLALEARLFPAEASERPPARAPGVARLRKALKQLHAGVAPSIDLDELTADLQFLRLFERAEHVLRRGALDRLLGDVVEPPQAVARPKPARIIKFGRRGGA